NFENYRLRVLAQCGRNGVIASDKCRSPVDGVGLFIMNGGHRHLLDLFLRRTTSNRKQCRCPPSILSWESLVWSYKKSSVLRIFTFGPRRESGPTVCIVQALRSESRPRIGVLSNTPVRAINWWCCI